MASMLRKSRTLGWEACPCRMCKGPSRGKALWRRKARRKEGRDWLAEWETDEYAAWCERYAAGWGVSVEVLFSA